MDFKHIYPCDDLESLYNEIRINLIRVNNKYCAKAFEEDGKCCIFHFEIFTDPAIDLSAIIALTFEMEGVADALGDDPEEEHIKALKGIADRLEAEMQRLP